MKYALQSDERIEATPKASGSCPCCETEVTAVCGTRKVWHWRHKNKLICDHWWENETQWHRDWKDHFFKEWQEVVHVAEGGEKHIADVKTPSGLVIEFQHSAISPDEKSARESFYQDMIWVVDGRRLKRDFPRFCERRSDWRKWPFNETTYDNNAFHLFPAEWLKRNVPVVFDWGYEEPQYNSSSKLSRTRLICLLPSVHGYGAHCFPIRLTDFVNMIIERQKLTIPPLADQPKPNRFELEN